MREIAEMIGDSGIKVPGIGVIVYKNGVEICAEFYGCRTLHNNAPMTRDSRFRVASVSKMFTMFTVMQLVESGRIDLDTDVSEYLNFLLRNPNHPSDKITVRMLACHTSSLRDGKIYSIPPNFSVEEFFMPTGKFWEDGTHFGKEHEYFSYSNLNYGLLGTIIEAVTGKRFDIYQRENILAQLDTKADYVVGNFDSDEFAMLGASYQKKNSCGVWNENGDWYGKVDDYRGIQPARETIALQNPYAEDFQASYSLEDYRVGTNATIFSPQGGLRISFEELTHVLKMLINGGIYGTDLMFRPQWIYNPRRLNGDTYGNSMLSYGLGTHSISFNGRNFVGHTGVAFGLLAGIFVSGNDGFVYIINGTAIDEDNDPRSSGQIGNYYIWEAKIFDAVTRLLID